MSKCSYNNQEFGQYLDTKIFVLLNTNTQSDNFAYFLKFNVCISFKTVQSCL